MVGVIGISYKSAPVDIRGRFALNETEIVNFISSLKEQKRTEKFVVLSTCNRTEIYFYYQKERKASNYNAIFKAFVKLWNITSEYKKYFYSYYGKEAISHLFNVASGIDAMVLGEDQILGQVKEAFRISCVQEITGSVLNKLFHKSFEIGKKVRTMTEINEGAASVSSAAVELITNYHQDLEKVKVLLIGAGQTGELTMKCLLKKGVKEISITNRDFAKAQKLAEIYSGTSVEFETIDKNITESDIVIISTGAREPIVTSSMIKDVMLRRQGKDLFMIDISVPRNIDPEVNNIEGVFLFDMDDLEKVIRKNYSKRASEIEKAKEMIDKYTEDFSSWLNTIYLTPSIVALKEKFEAINNRELETYKKKMSEEEFKKVKDVSNFITAKYVNMIVENLILSSQNGKKVEYMELVNELFELNKQQ
jgi:glutamyl-tRNA reductase